MRCLEPVSNNGFWLQVKAQPDFKPQATCWLSGNLPVVEDLKEDSNAEMEPKDFFEMGSSR
jgi:hypothetical protein